MAFARLETRIAALEGVTSSNSENDLKEDANAFSDTLSALAGRFSDDEGGTALTEQTGWATAVRLAWALRFGTPVECDAILTDVKAMVACRE